MDKRVLLVIATLFIFTLPWITGAQTPSVVSFTASSASANSGTPISFSWDLQDAGGYSFVIPCVTGVEAKRTTGTDFACDTPLTSTSATDDFISLRLYNVSGGAKTVTARLTPKDGGGQDVTSAQQSVSVSVATLAEPILSFTTSSTTASIRDSITISWTSQIIDGVNLSIECKSDIKASSTSYTTAGFMPCNTPIFTTDLGTSGSLTVNFSNTSKSDIPYKLTLLPAITPGTYDGTHSETLDLTIASDILPNPTIDSFTTSASTVDSGEPLTINWTSANTSGVNIRIPCITNITATTSANSNTALPCGENIFDEALNTQGSYTIGIENKNPISRSVIISIVPGLLAGGYDATRKKDRTITVRAAVAAEPEPLSEPTTPPPDPEPDPEPSPIPTPTPPTPVPQPTPSPTPPQPSPTPKPIPSPTPEPTQPTTATSLPIQFPPPVEDPIIIPPRIETVEDRLEKKLIEKEVLSYAREITPTTTGEGSGRIYEVVGRKQVDFFFFIPIYMEVRVEISASGEILKTKKPWWSFLAR